MYQTNDNIYVYLHIVALHESKYFAHIKSVHIKSVGQLLAFLLPPLMTNSKLTQLNCLTSSLSSNNKEMPTVYISISELKHRKQRERTLETGLKWDMLTSEIANV